MTVTSALQSFHVQYNCILRQFRSGRAELGTKYKRRCSICRSPTRKKTLKPMYVLMAFSCSPSSSHRNIKLQYLSKTSTRIEMHSCKTGPYSGQTYPKTSTLKYKAYGSSGCWRMKLHPESSNVIALVYMLTTIAVACNERCSCGQQSNYRRGYMA